jgi:hypothetical protein
MRPLLFSLAVLLVACNKDERAKPPPALADAAAVTTPALDASVAPVAVAPDADAWRAYPVGDAFVKSPVPPEQTTVDVPSDDGTVPAAQYVFAPSEQGMFAVMVVTTPPGLDKSIEQLLADSRDGMMGLYGATVLSDDAVTVDGVPGRNIAFHGDIPDVGPVHGRAIVFVQGTKTYTGAYLGMGRGTGRDPTADRFIESFRFTATP